MSLYLFNRNIMEAIFVFFLRRLLSIYDFALLLPSDKFIIISLSRRIGRPMYGIEHKKLLEFNPEHVREDMDGKAVGERGKMYSRPILIALM